LSIQAGSAVCHAGFGLLLLVPEEPFAKVEPEAVVDFLAPGITEEDAVVPDAVAACDFLPHPDMSALVATTSTTHTPISPMRTGSGPRGRADSAAPTRGVTLCEGLRVL
jgi:hypothetical protein